MLRVGLSGGIGSGKSTVSRRLAELGALVIDADVLAREVVAPGSPGLAAVGERFGASVIAADGSLDRPALGALVFGDEQARRDLEAITHPRIAQRTAELMAAAPPGQVVVHDVPLLVEKDYGPRYHLVVIVGADEDTRVRRLVATRGMSEAEARSRITAQVDDQQRRAVADVWLDNTGSLSELTDAVDRLWSGRLTGFNDNLLAGRPSRCPDGAPAPYDPAWRAQAARLAARIRWGLEAAGLAEQVVTVQHVGPTSVPGTAARDVIDLQLEVHRLEDADAPMFTQALAAAGYPRAGARGDDPSSACGPGAGSAPERLHGSADPGRPACLHVREVPR